MLVKAINVAASEQGKSRAESNSQGGFKVLGMLALSGLDKTDVFYMLTCTQTYLHRARLRGQPGNGFLLTSAHVLLIRQRQMEISHSILFLLDWTFLLIYFISPRVALHTFPMYPDSVWVSTMAHVTRLSRKKNQKWTKEVPMRLWIKRPPTNSWCSDRWIIKSTTQIFEMQLPWASRVPRVSGTFTF